MAYAQPSYPDMREAGIGRVLVASLHQGIADILPTRLAFYENWLNAEGLREGTIGLAPLYAVLSFLRQEGDAYTLITTRAGEYAADWTVQSMTPIQRAMLKAAPLWLRSRMLLRLAQRLVHSSYQRQPRDRTGPARVGARRSARLGVLHRAREGAASALRFLRRRVHQAAGAVRHQREHRGGRVPRHRRTHLRAERVVGHRAAGRIRAVEAL